MIRPAKEEDAAGIARIHVETWRAAYAGIMPAEFLASLSVENRIKMWVALLDRNPRNLLVAEDAGEMSGFCHSVLFRGEGTRICGETMAVYVLPQFQGRGHGLALMQATEADFRARGVAEAVLWVLEANHPTRRFYERFGYQPDGGVKQEECGPAKLPVLRYRKSF